MSRIQPLEVIKIPAPLIQRKNLLLQERPVMVRIISLCLLLMLFILGASPVVSELVATFEIVDIPPAVWIFARTSGDGSVTAVNNGGAYYRVVDGDAQYLGFGHPLSWSIGVSKDGTSIIGTMVDQDTGWRNPAIWTEIEGWTLLGGVPGGLQCDNSLGSGYDLDGDGSKGVGLAWSTQLCKAAGFLCTLEDGMIQLDREPELRHEPKTRREGLRSAKRAADEVVWA